MQLIRGKFMHQNSDDMLRWIEIVCITSFIIFLLGICSATEETAEEWNSKGATLSKNGQYEDAISAYNQALTLDSQFFWAWMGKADALYNSGKYSDAINAYNESINIDPQYIWAWIGKGTSFQKIGQYDNALASFDKAIEVNISDVSGYQYKAYLFHDMNQFDEAIALEDKIIELDKNYITAYLTKASILQSLDKYDQAIESYNQALEINKSYAPAYVGKAAILSAQKKFNEALIAYENAIEIDPTSIWAWNGRGNILERLNRYEDAVKSYEHAISLNESYAPAWNSKAFALQTLKKPTEALSAYDQAIVNDPDSYWPYLNKGYLLLNLNRISEAEEAFNHAIKINQSEVYAWNAKGTTLMSAEKYEGAIINFEESLKINPDQPEIKENLELAQFKVFLASNKTQVSTIVQNNSSVIEKLESGIEPDTKTTPPNKEGRWPDIVSSILEFITGSNNSIPQKVTVISHKEMNFPDQIILLSPVAISQYQDTFLIADDGNRSIIRVDFTGNIIQIINGDTLESDNCRQITGVTSDSQGNYYILDAQSAMVHKYDNQGTHVGIWGSNGTEPGQFINPRQIEYASITEPKQEMIMIADTGNNRIQFFDLQGNYVSSITKLYNSSSYQSSTRFQSQTNISDHNPLYSNIKPDENAYPPETKRTFNFNLKDTTITMSVKLNRSEYLGAQKNSVIDFNVNEKNPEQWEQILKGILMDPITSESINETIKSLRESSQGKRITESDFFDYLYNFIQQIPLADDSDRRYPIEVLHDKKGSSTDKALFLYHLLYEAGYDVVLLTFPETNHCAVAVRVDKSVRNAAMKEYEFGNRTYAYINPDIPEFIGKISPEFDGVDPFILNPLSQDKQHCLTLPYRENRLFIAESIDWLQKKQTFLLKNMYKYDSSVRIQASSDLNKISTILEFIKRNTWNTDAAYMRLKNSKVLEIQFNYGGKESLWYTIDG